MTEKRELELIPEEDLAKVSGGLKVKAALKGVGIILFVGVILYSVAPPADQKTVNIEKHHR